ncbi:DUF4128 domain-containing protein [Cupriavidus nantongensis]|uniref:DUF4128 domain-containing protein n=1 Tax=Cupriavidus nantongensis TaxID=1796606 RepID=UPI0009ED3775|nr:DUF4128 domain-containing protein [Cupriavidus nantongensis]
MSLSLIRRALEKHLLAMAPVLPLAPENVPFTPTPGAPYQRVHLLPATPANPTMGDGFYREVGVFQVSLYYPQGTGPAAAQTRAEAVRNYFPRGLLIPEGGISTRVERTPAISSGVPDGDRWCIHVSIQYSADIFT